MGGRFMKLIKMVIILTLGVVLIGCSYEIEGEIPVNVSFPLNLEENSIITEDLSREIALGHIDGDFLWNQWAHNEDVDNGVQETVWNVGGEFVRLTSPQLINISSTSGLDTTGGTGTQAVVIWGINGSWEEVIDVVFLDGTNTVQSNFEYLGGY